MAAAVVVVQIRRHLESRHTKERRKAMYNRRAVTIFSHYFASNGRCLARCCCLHKTFVETEEEPNFRQPNPDLPVALRRGHDSKLNCDEVFLC